MIVKPKKLPFKKFQRIFSQVPRSTIDLIIKTPEGILLGKREIEPCLGQWHYPGGTILLGEKINETIKRVAFEETGLKLKVVKMLGVMEFLPTGNWGHIVSHVYLTEPISGILRGSFQANDMQYFKKPPANTVKEHVLFWKKYKLT